MKKQLLSILVIAVVAVSITAGAASFVSTGSQDNTSNFVSTGSTSSVDRGSNFVSTGSTSSVDRGSNFVSTGSTPPGPAVVVPDNNGGSSNNRGPVSKGVVRNTNEQSGMTFMEWVSIYGPIVDQVPEDKKPEENVKPPVKKPVVKKPVLKNTCDCVNMTGDIVFLAGEKMFSVTSNIVKGQEIVEFSVIDCGLMTHSITNVVENAYAEISVRGKKVTIVVKNVDTDREIWRLVINKD